MRTISYGGGVQSTALVVLAVQGRIDFDAALFCNVGDDSEHPDTLDYVRDVATPWAAERGLPIHTLVKRPTRGRFAGKVETLYGRLTHPDSQSDGIPVRMASGAPGSRACTADFKIRVMQKWHKAHGATPDNPTIVAIGISTDEFHRAGRGRDEAYEKRTYPLLDLDLSRQDCVNIISRAGLPVPPKSACYFCPYTRLRNWQELRRDRPDLFEKAAALEDHMNARRSVAGKDPVWFTDKLIPLRAAAPVAQDTLFDADYLDDDGGCDSGHCFT